MAGKQIVLTQHGTPTITGRGADAVEAADNFAANLRKLKDAEIKRTFGGLYDLLPKTAAGKAG